MEAIDFLLNRELEEIEITKGKILNPNQEMYLRAVFTELTLAAALVNLERTSEDRQHAELVRAVDAGKRAFILELLEGSESAKAELRQLDQSSNQTRS